MGKEETGNIDQMRNTAMSDLGINKESDTPEEETSVKQTEEQTDTKNEVDTLSQIELDDAMRKEYGISGDVKSIKDVLRQFKELNSMRGRQGEELGSVRQQIAQLQQAYNQAQTRLDSMSNPKVNPEEEEAAFLQELSTKPRDAMRKEIEKALETKMSNIEKQLQGLGGYVQRQNIDAERRAFIDARKLSEDDQQTMADMIAKEPEYYKAFPSTQAVLRAAYAELMERKGYQTQQAEPQKADVKQVQVTGSKVTRPRTANTAQTLDEKREAAMRELGIQT